MRKKVKTPVRKEVPKPPPVELPVVVPTVPPPVALNPIQQEVAMCCTSCEYFISHYCIIDDKSLGKKFLFDLWESQKPVLDLFVKERKVVVLKSRQVGLTWLALCKAIWTGLIDKPGSTILLFSLRDDEAVELLSRVKGIYDRLPNWMKCKKKIKDDEHDLKLSNGTEFKAFPTGKGDSYTASMAILDEFDLLEPEMQLKMLESIEPTVRAAGQLILISKANKGVKWSDSQFKKIYISAKAGDPVWKAIFLPWYSRPDMTMKDYDYEKQKCFNKTGSFDGHYGNYPSSDEEALAPSTGDKRFPYEWLQRCHRHQDHASPSVMREMVPQLTHIRGLRIFKEPAYGAQHVGGCDPAEGTTSSNPSAIVVVDRRTGEEVLSMNEKLTPRLTAKAISEISKVYNTSWMIARNNHGHAVILALQELYSSVRLLEGDDDSEGWQENKRTKTLMYDDAADKIREGHAIIHSFDLYTQMSMVESDTLDSPKGPGNSHGDLATAFVLALKGCDIDRYGEFRESDFQWGDNAQTPRPFGVADPRRPSGPFGTVGGGGGHSPFGMR